MMLVSISILNVSNVVKTQMRLDAADHTRWRPPGLSTALTVKNVVLTAVSHLLVNADTSLVSVTPVDLPSPPVKLFPTEQNLPKTVL